MLALIAAVPLLFAAAAEKEPVHAHTPDGGHVPTVAPKLTPRLAPVLAPELVSDGGTVAASPTLSVYDVDIPSEAVITGGSVALYVIVDFLIKPTLEGDVSCRQPIGNGRCNPDDLTGLDRLAVGKNSKEWKAFGDVTLTASLIAPIVYLGLESIVLPTVDPWGDWGGDLLVVSEAMALTGAVQVVMKFAFRRPRPVRYQDVEVPLSTFDQELSFPSGHVSLVAASTTALTTTVFLRHPESQVKYVVLGAGVLLTTLTAVSRVEAGQHFPTDVMIGSLVGGIAGFMVPWVHRRRYGLIPTASINPVTGESVLGLGGTF